MPRTIFYKYNGGLWAIRFTDNWHTLALFNSHSKADFPVSYIRFSFESLMSNEDSSDKFIGDIGISYAKNNMEVLRLLADIKENGERIHIE